MAGRRRASKAWNGQKRTSTPGLSGGEAIRLERIVRPRLATLDHATRRLAEDSRDVCYVPRCVLIIRERDQVNRRLRLGALHHDLAEAASNLGIVVKAAAEYAPECRGEEISDLHSWQVMRSNEREVFEYLTKVRSRADLYASLFLQVRWYFSWRISEGPFIMRVIKLLNKY